MKNSHANDNVYPEGSYVHAKENSYEKLHIRRYVDGIYYCRSVLNPTQKERVYFERELSAAVSST
jgi:hypothetical protein